MTDQAQSPEQINMQEVFARSGYLDYRASQLLQQNQQMGQRIQQLELENEQLKKTVADHSTQGAKKEAK